MLIKNRCKNDDALPRFRVDLFLLTVRGSVIVLWTCMLVNAVQMSVWLQIFFAAIIFISDAFDGIFSRRYTTSSERYKFRILDAFIDKIGIVLFITTLLILKKIPYLTLIIIIGYNVILILPPVFKILTCSENSLQWIQATFWSRFYAFCVGIYCLLSIVTDIALKYKITISSFFLVLSIISFLSHIRKIRQIKGAI